MAPCALLAMGLLAGASSGQDIKYALFRLPLLNPEDPQYAPLALNAWGQLCGQANTPSQDLHAAIWEFNSVLDLGAIGGDNSAAHGINDLGEAVGWTGRGPSDGRAFLWQNNQMIDLGTLGGQFSAAYGVNNLTQIVGAAGNESGSSDAFLWENGEMRALPSLVEGRPQSARAINEHGQIVGDAWPESSEIAVMWEDGQVFQLPHLGDSPSIALAINDNGQAVGQSRMSGKTHAAAWVNRQVFDLHRSGLGKHSSAWGINNLGYVVGWVGEPPISTKAFLWTQATGMQILDPMVPPRLRENWTLTFARDINDAGQIATQGVIHGRPLTLYAFLRSPVSPSMEMTAPAPGAAGVANTITVSSVTPGATVTFLYSRHGGGTPIPGCDLQQNALQLDSPTVIGSAIADSNGVASITRSVPLLARGQTILFQAVVQNECAISQLVVHTFE